MPDKIQDKRKRLYDALVAADYDAGADFNDFNNLMDTDEVARQWVYDTAKSEGWKVGDNFEQFVGYITPAQESPTPQAKNVPYEFGKPVYSQAPNHVEGDIYKHGDSYTRTEIPYRTVEYPTLGEAQEAEKAKQREDALAAYRSAYNRLEAPGEVDEKTLIEWGNNMENAPIEQKNLYTRIMGQDATNRVDLDAVMRSYDETRKSLEGVEDPEGLAAYLMMPAEQKEKLPEDERSRYEGLIKDKRKTDAVDDVNELHERISSLMEQQRVSDIKMHRDYLENRSTGQAIKDAILGIPVAEAPQLQGAIPSSGLDLTPEGKFSNEQNAALTAAGRRWNEMKYLINAAQNGNLFDGLDKALGSIDTWTSDQMLRDNMAIMRVANKFDEEGEKSLTDNERALLDALALNVAVSEMYGDEISNWYKGGEMLGEMAPFMLEMLMNPLSGLGKKAADKVTRIIEKYGKDIVKKNAKKFALTRGAAKLGASVAGATGMALTTGLPAVGADIQKRMLGDATYGYDNEGNIEYTGHVGGEDLGTSAYKAVTSRMLDNVSEMLGAEYASLPLKWLQKAGKGTKLLGWIDNLANSKFGKGVSRFAEKTKWNGPIEEFLEEVHVGLINPVLVGDQSWEEFFTKDNLATIAIGVAVPGAAISTANTIAGAADGAFKVGAQERWKMQNAEAMGYQLWQDNPNEWNDLTRSLIEGQMEDVEKALKEVYNNPQLTPDQKKVALEYGVYSLQWRTAKGVEEAFNEGKKFIDPMLRDIYGTAYAEKVSPVQANNAYKAMAEAEKNAQRVLGIGEESVDEWLNGRSAEEATNDAAQQEAIKAYQAAKLDFEGRRDRYIAEKGRAYMESDRSIQANDNNGMVYATQLKDEPVFITGGNVALNEDGTIDVNNSSEVLYVKFPDGHVEMTSPDKFTEVFTSDRTTDLKAAKRAEIDERWKAEFDTAEVLARQQEVEQEKRDSGVVFDMTDPEGTHRVEILNEGNGMADILLDGKEEQIPTEELNRWKQEAGIQTESAVADDATDNGTPTESEANVAPSGDNIAPVAPVELPNVPDFFRLGGRNYEVASRNDDGSVDVMVNGKRETLPAGTDYSTHMPTDKKGEVQYEKMPVERTHEYFVQKVKDDEARAEMIEKRRKKAESERKKFDKKPDPGIDPDAYEAKITQWEADKKAAQAKVDYWNEVAKRDAEITRSETREAVENIKPDVMKETADEFIANQLAGIKITPESFKRETGLSNAEQAQLVGVISNDGVSVERAAEIILENYDSELAGMGFTGDVQDVRDIIISVLSQGNPRSYAKRGREAREAESMDQQRADAEAWAKGAFDMKLEELYLYEETVLPRIVREYEGFDENEYYSNLAENNEYDTTRESESIGRGGELLQGEQSVPAGGTPVVGQRNEGGAVSDDVQGGGQNGVAQEEVPVNEPVGNSEQLSSSEIPNNQSVAEGDAPGQSGVYADNQGNPVDADGKLIVDEVNSIDEITDEDFETPTRNVQLPAIPENVANAIGTNGRPVVIKKNVFEKNGNTHVELEPEDSRNILRSALYNPNLVGSTQPIRRPDYKVAIRTGEQNAVVVLDVYQEKDFVEIVGWRMVNEKGLAKMQRQAEREGGQFLILSPNDGSAAALSALPLGLSSASEDRNSVSNSQENTQESGEIAENGGGRMYSQEELAETKEQLGELNATSAPNFAVRLFSIRPWGALEEANAALKELLASYGETLNGQTAAVLPFLDEAQRLISENSKNQETAFLETLLDNGDKRITSYNSRGEVATVAIERDGKVVSVDSYDEGVLFEHTEYDGNGKASSVTRYDKQGNVVGTQVYEDGKAKTPMQKLADRILDRAEEKRRIPLRERARELEAQVGVKANIIESVDEVADPEARRRIVAGQNVAGWYSKGEVYLYMPNLQDRREIELTYVHEVVAHHGVKKLLGKRFNEFLDGVWNMMSEADRARMLTYVSANENPTLQDMRAAADEYVAELAEKMNLGELEQSTWDKIVGWLKELLENIGFENLTKEDIESMLKASYANLRSTEQGAQSTENDFRAKMTFHGSGAQFDRFDHSFMGTGEGAQAFGWGTYVTEVEGIGKQYAEAVVQDKNPNIEESVVDIRRYFRYNPLGIDVDTIEDAKRHLDAITKDFEGTEDWDSVVDDIEDLRGLIVEWEKLENAIRYNRNLYTVEIPDDNGSNYLHWEDVVPKKVDTAVKERLLERLSEGQGEAYKSDLKQELDDVFRYSDFDGASLYKNISAYLGGDKQASLFLNDMGFVGISYPANATTGGRADGARNYVIFNENDAQIKDRTMFRKKDSERRQEKRRINDIIDTAAGFITVGGKKQATKNRLKKEAERKQLAKEMYSSVLKGDFNDVTLSQIDKFIEDATPANPFGRRISQRLPQRMERALRQGARTNAVDVLFSRISESAVPANERFSEAGRREIEERKKELLKGWAIATGNWHTDLKEFTDDTEPIGEGKDSKVYSSKDGRYVIKASKGKPYGKRFRPDIDNIALFNDVFRDTRYEILGYGEIDGEFVRILQQPIVDFAQSTPLTSEERREYMQSLGFEPLNDANTAFADGEIVIADLQKGNVVRDAAGNISVIDADAKLHTKDVGGDYTYPPVEEDLPEQETMFRKVENTENNSIFASTYKTEDGKNINYTSERTEGYGVQDDGIGNSNNGSRRSILQRQTDTGVPGADSGLDAEKGEFCVVERVFTENGAFNFTSGEKIESADDVAYIFSALEDVAKEHSFVVYVKDGMPTVVELGMGSFNATMVDVPTASLAYSRINPDHVYFVHNHPSGNLICSSQDVAMLRVFEDMSDVPVTGVIINLKTGKYGTFDTERHSVIGEKRVPEKEERLAVHTLDKQIFAPDYDPMAQPLVRGSQDVAQFLNSQRMGDRPKVSFLILSRANRIIGNIHTPFTNITTDVEAVARYINERVIQFGGENAILYGDFAITSVEGMDFRLLQNAMDRFGKTKLLDVVRVEGNFTRSANDMGLLYEPEAEYKDGQTMFRIADDVITTVNDFNSTHKGAAPTVTIDSINTLEEQLRARGFSEGEIERAKDYYLDGDLAVYFPGSDYVVINRHDVPKDELIGYLWHENAHRAVGELYTSEEIERAFNAVYGVRAQEIREELEKAGYNPLEHAEESIVRGIEDMYLDETTRGKLEKGDWKVKKDATEEQRYVIEFTNQIINFINNGEEQGIRGRRGRTDNTNARENAQEIERGQDVEMRNPEGKGETTSTTGTETEDARFRTVEETTEGSIDDVPAQPLTLMERIANSLLEVSAKNKENLELRASALRTFGRDINRVLSLMKAQREYDKSTVDTLVKLAKMYFKNAQLLGEVDTYTMGRVLSLINNVVGKRDVTASAAKLMDILLDAHTKALAGILDKAEKVKAKKVNAAGVEVMGRLDKYGQRRVDEYRAAKEMTPEKLEEAIYDSDNRLAELEQRVREELRLPEGDVDQAAREYTGDNDVVNVYMDERARLEGLTLAREYKESIQQVQEEIKDLKRELKQAEEDYRLGNIDGKSLKEFRKSVAKAIMESKAGLIEGYHSLIYKFQENTKESSQRAKEFVQAQIDSAREIQNNANSDLLGHPAEAQGETPDKWNSSVPRLFMSAMPTFQTMLKFFGEKAADGRGYLYERFIPQYTQASHNEYVGKTEAREKMRKKLTEIFGEKTSIEKFMDMSRKDGVVLEYQEGGEKKTIDLTRGQVLYLYMINKMADGQMKLSRMGITDADVLKMAKELPEEMVRFADWVQEEFLTELREKYNKVHERMFGAPMAAIESYFPIKINKRSRGEKIEPGMNAEDKPSTVTGSVIKRTKNAVAIDLSADAMQVLLGHIDDMENWAAFAEFRRDVKLLLNYRHFQNQVKGMVSLRYGSGEGLWKNFVDVANIAAGSFKPSSKTPDRFVRNIAKGVVSSKIAFRYFTAVKQILSTPAFWSEVDFGKMMNAYLHQKEAWDWAMKNLPGFSKRWEGRASGNEILLESDADWKVWQNRAVQWLSKEGMRANAFIDALTVATGAKAVFETKYEMFKKAGYSEERAREKALNRAAEAYNESQQSSESAYLSPLQAEATFVSSVLTAYRNSPFGYNRKMATAIANLKKKMKKGFKQESIEYMTKQLMRDGLNEEQAKKFAKSTYRRSVARDAADVALYGFFLNYVWVLGPSLIYILLGDDDEKKKELHTEALIDGAMGGLGNLPAGETLTGAIKAIAEGDVSNFKLPQAVAMQDIETIADLMQTDPVRAAGEVLNILVAMNVGVNPQTFTDMFVALAYTEDWSDPREIAMLVLRLINAPNSKLELLEADEAMENYGANIEEITREFAEYQKSKRAPLSGWLYSDEGEQKAIERYEKRFKKILDERFEVVVENTDEYDMWYENSDPQMKAKLAKMRKAYLEGDKKATFEKLDAEELVKKILYGAGYNEVNTVYYELSTAEDEDMAMMIDTKLKELQPMMDEYKKLRGDERKAYREENLEQIQFYDKLNDYKNKVNNLKGAMKEEPERAQEHMNKIRELRAKAMELINNYRKDE